MTTRLCLLLVVTILMTPAPYADVPKRGSLLFITSKEQATASLSVAEVRNIYLGRTTRWPDGRRITVIVRPATTEAGRAFLRHVVRMSEIDFSQDWLGVVFRGHASSPPRVIGQAEAVRKLVAGNAGAIGVVLSSELTEEDEAHLQILAIDGKTPGEESYPFAIGPR
jgi:ABC-type phosphate transport system substrate-binding protein